MARERTFTKSKIPNLYKYAPNDTYYGRAKIGGKTTWKSLDTRSFEVAQHALSKWMESVRKQRKSSRSQVGKITFAYLYEEYEKETASNPDFVPGTKDSRIYSLGVLKKTWPKLEKLSPISLTYNEVKDWANRLKRDGTGFVAPGAKKGLKGNSSSNVNKTVSTLARLIDIAIKQGLAVENVARLDGLKMKDSAKQGHVPSKSDFKKLQANLDPACAFCARFLASTGCRIGEARAVLWKDVSFQKGEIWIRGTKTETSNRRIPITDQLRKDLENRLRIVKAEAGRDTSEIRVFPRDDLNKPLARACKKIGIPKTTNHDLRDYFATTCLEAGIPVHTVAVWLGHNDGGALLLKTYAHLRDQHSIQVAKGLEF